MRPGAKIVTTRAARQLMRYPTRATAIRRASRWAGPDHFEEVCDALAGGRASPASKAVLVALKAYMKHGAPVVPAVPRALASRPPRVLYRGLHLESPPEVGDVMQAGRPDCFAAFTYDPEIARTFAEDGFVYRLQVDRIARGTPWAWFDTALSNSLRAEIQESEVLLPPGHLKVLRRSMDPGGLVVVDVAYAPHAEYLRRGVLPRPGQAPHEWVYKTAGGHRLALRSPRVTNTVSARRAM